MGNLNPTNIRLTAYPEVEITCFCGAGMVMQGEGLSMPCLSCGRVFTLQVLVTMHERPLPLFSLGSLEYDWAAQPVEG